MSDYTYGEQRMVPPKAKLEPKPCPTCYRPMRLIAQGEWRCEKHGEPKRP